MQLRPYQQQFENDIYSAWNQGATNVCGVLPTGAGKTVSFSNIIHKHNGASTSIAHRQELVSQISLAFAREEVPHRIIGPQTVISNIVKMQTREFGRSYYDPSALAAVAGVDTLIRRADKLHAFCQQTSLWVMDEGHHVLRANKWGRAADMFPNAKGLGVTATPSRADGQGLGRHADGLYDSLVVGPGMRDLIDQRYLSDYRIFAPPSDMDLSSVQIGSTGDYSAPQLRAASHKSHIVGDVVTHYTRIAPTKRGVVFAVDVETAGDIAHQFNTVGIKAAAISAKTPDVERFKIVNDFRNGLLQVLVNVDIFGEGFDLPAVEVVVMARPTMSYGLYCQQFGRALRIMNGKDYAIIIDHVGNVGRHGLPDRARVWSLDRREKNARGARDPDLIPTRACTACAAVYEAIYKDCPYCGAVYVYAERGGPEYVDGDLIELDPSALAALRGEIAAVDKSHDAVASGLRQGGTPKYVANAVAENHRIRYEYQRRLRDVIALWAGHQRALARPDSESYRRFYFRYGVDVLTAQTLGKADAVKLCNKVAADLASGELG